jgi:type IV pilus assembly protein PilB
MRGPNTSSRNSVPALLISALAVALGLTFVFLFSNVSPQTWIGKAHTVLSHPVSVVLLIILMTTVLIATLMAIFQAIKAKQEARDRLRQRHEDIIMPIRVYDLESHSNDYTRIKMNAVPAKISQLCRRGDKGVPDLVDGIICYAIQTRTSDIHLEPSSVKAAVKYRQDGVLHDVGQIPRNLMGRLSSRLRVLANLTIYEKGKPQDGRIEIKWNKKNYDIRLSFLPTLHGDKIVIRLFESGEHDFNLKYLGLSPEHLDQLSALLLRPQGTLFLTGPTGSGKTTTIYSAVRHILQNRGETTNIVTIEDPIEREIQGVNQTQVNPKRDLTFACGLRSILRQDPDVIVVGEVRDRETAEICTQAGLTGHLVISTIHADSAVGVFNRLIEMGIEPFLVASSISGILSQRLLRRNCPHCLEPVVPSLNALKVLGVRPGQNIRFVRGRGCDMCDYKGYKGRIGIFELLQPTPRLKEALQSKISTGELYQLASRDGMKTLLEDGLQKVVDGHVDVEELVRNLI